MFLCSRAKTAVVSKSYRQVAREASHSMTGQESEVITSMMIRSD